MKEKCLNMKKEKISQDIDNRSEDKVPKKGTKKKGIRMAKWVAGGALICGILIASIQIKNNFNSGYPSDVSAVVAVYPKQESVGSWIKKKMNSDKYWEMLDEYYEKIEKSKALFPEMEGYYSSLMEKLLISDDENTVCSPLNIYIAFAVLSEVTDGNTRQQILDMLNTGDIDTLRKNVSALWENNYSDTKVLKSILANSVWIDSKVECNDKTLDLLAEKYYASSFRGKPGSSEMNKAMSKWIDSNTGGLLKEYTKDMSMASNTVFSVLSTIFYKAAWSDDFYERSTVPEIFHGTAGDTTVEMMKKSDLMGVYRTDNFISVGLKLEDSGEMYFILPDEEYDVNSLVSDPDIMNAIREYRHDENYFYPEVHLSVPKFKVTNKVDLIDTLRSMGIADILDYIFADFTPLTEETDLLYLSGAEHTAMVEIDEHGVTGAAYTKLDDAPGSPMPEGEVDIVINRPFMFAVTGKDGSLLFSGIVRNIS